MATGFFSSIYKYKQRNKSIIYTLQKIQIISTFEFKKKAKLHRRVNRRFAGFNAG
jgi:hypothetical protein